MSHLKRRAALRMLHRKPEQVESELKTVIIEAQNSVLREGTHDVCDLSAFATVRDLAEVIAEMLRDYQRAAEEPNERKQ